MCNIFHAPMLKCELMDLPVGSWFGARSSTGISSTSTSLLHSNQDPCSSEAFLSLSCWPLLQNEWLVLIIFQRGLWAVQKFAILSLLFWWKRCVLPPKHKDSNVFFLNYIFYFLSTPADKQCLCRPSTNTVCYSSSHGCSSSLTTSLP